VVVSTSHVLQHLFIDGEKGDRKTTQFAGM
jgi:hypothetical protein